ncbi:hypothetical protein BGZ99_004070, partial [Dissophora globulifera]
MSVKYSPSGHQIASGSSDETVRLWDVDSGQCLVVVDDTRVGIETIAWNPTFDGMSFATGSDNSVRSWRVIEEEGQFQAQLLW